MLCVVCFPWVFFCERLIFNPIIIILEISKMLGVNWRRRDWDGRCEV